MKRMNSLFASAILILHLAGCAGGVQLFETNSDIERGSRGVQSRMKIVNPTAKADRPFGLILLNDQYSGGKKITNILFVKKNRSSDIPLVTDFDLINTSLLTQEDLLTFINGLDRTMKVWNGSETENDAFYYDFTAFKEIDQKNLPKDKKSALIALKFSCVIVKENKKGYIKWGRGINGDMIYFHEFKDAAAIVDLKSYLEDAFFQLTKKEK